jgi:hypothetical protein
MTWHWPWRRRNGTGDAKQELEHARRELQETRNRWPEVHEAAEAMRAHVERNHFAEKLVLIYTGRKP